MRFVPPDFGGFLSGEEFTELKILHNYILFHNYNGIDSVVIFYELKLKL